MSISQSSVTLRDYECVICKTAYQAKRYVQPKQRYCSPRCKDSLRLGVRKQSRAERKLSNRLDDFPKSAFAAWLFSEIRKAGTVEILRALKTPEDLDNLYYVYSYSYRCYGRGSADQRIYNLCHVAHRKGHNDTVGLLCAQNLFTGDASYNKSQLNRPTDLSVGMYISRSSCKSKWDVEKSIVNTELFKLVRKYLGKAVFDKWLVNLNKKLHLTVHNRLAREIYNAQQKGKGSPLPQRFSRAELESEPLDKLRRLKSIQTGSESSSFRYDDYSSNWWDVYKHELDRFAAYDTDALHRSNCIEMSSCISIVKHPDYFSLGHSVWNQFLYYKYPRTELGEVDRSEDLVSRDVESLLEHIRKSSFNALQGNDPGIKLLESRIRKRFKVLPLVPSLEHATCLSYNPDLFWSREYENFIFQTERDWSTLRALGFVPEAAIAAARATLLDNLVDAHGASVARWRHMNRWAGDLPAWFSLPDFQALLNGQSQDRQEAA